MAKTIDLGKKMDTGLESAKVKDSAPKVYYPTVHITHDMSGDGSEMDSMPDEGDAMIHYKIVSYKEDKKDKTCSCELEITSITPSGSKSKPKKSSEDSLDAALNEIVSKKK